MGHKQPSQEEINRFKHLNFNSFQDLAKDDSLSPYQKIGFPNSYREGKEKAIFEDILTKMPALNAPKSLILDVGCGCSDLVFMLIAQAEKLGQTLLLNDGKAMLDLLPEQAHTAKIEGYFPTQTEPILSQYKGKIDGLLTYSVFHYVFEEGNIYQFIDACVELLAPQGQLLIGDVPNVSKRKRFFASDAGREYHQAYTKTDSLPPAFSFEIEKNQIDDGAIFGIIQRYRNAGCEAYVLPQSPNLPMANRREDILIIKG